VHLVRNAVDHGLEPTARRCELGKPEEGSLRLVIARDSESLLISVEDDGCGVDVEAIRQAAVERGLYSAQEAATLDRASLFDLLTRPAFTTRREVTEVSGRGVGLDVVRSAVESLGGHLEMESEKGKGGRFTLVIPSATTLTRVLVFGWDDGIRFALPASQIRRIYPLSTFPLVWSGSDRCLQAGEELLPVLRWRPGPVGREGAALRILSEGRDRVLLVSRLYQGERVVVLPWGHPLEMVSEWMGGALLSTGEIAYVLDGRVLAKREGD
jgi:two-component system chemotaxis sensor kinase CheA